MGEAGKEGVNMRAQRHWILDSFGVILRGANLPAFALTLLLLFDLLVAVLLFVAAAALGSGIL